MEGGREQKEIGGEGVTGSRAKGGNDNRSSTTFIVIRINMIRRREKKTDRPN